MCVHKYLNLQIYIHVICIYTYVCRGCTEQSGVYSLQLGICIIFTEKCFPQNIYTRLEILEMYTYIHTHT